MTIYAFRQYALYLILQSNASIALWFPTTTISIIAIIRQDKYFCDNNKAKDALILEVIGLRSRFQEFFF